jgi:hypothetical protein
VELSTNDLQVDSRHLRSAGAVRRDEIEPLPEGFVGFWIATPAVSIHLVSTVGQ